MMMKKSLFLFPMLWSLGFGACSAGSLDDTDAQSEASEAEGAIAGQLPPQRCERLQVKFAPQGSSSTTTVNVPGPYKAAISADGKKMSCTGPTGDWSPSSFLEDFYANFVVRFQMNSNKTGLIFRDPLQPQRTVVRWSGPALGPSQRDWEAPISAMSCHPYTATITAPGFAEQRLTVVAELNGTPGQSGTLFRAGCKYRVKGPVTISRDKPPEVTGASGDRFVFQPTICQGDECPSPSCQRPCSAVSDCGHPSDYQCIQGCCASIIH